MPIIYHTGVSFWHTRATTAAILLLFSVNAHKTELIFQDDDCQQFMWMENLLSDSDLGAPT